MRKIIFFITILYMFANCEVKANNLILFSHENKYGYVDESLNVIILPKFRSAEHFSNLGYAIVCYQNGKNAVLDKEENVYLESENNLIYHLGEDLYSYSLPSMKSEIIRLRDEKIIASDLQSNCYAGTDRFILVSFPNENSQYSFIDFEGNRILPNLQMKKYSYPFYEGRAVTTNEDWEWVIIDLEGNNISNHDFYRLGQHYSEGLLPVQTKDYVTGYVNPNGQFEFKLPFVVSDIPEVTNFQNGYALIKQAQDVWNVIDKGGNVISNNLNISTASDFSDGLSKISIIDIFSKIRKYGFIDTNGNYFIPPILDDCDSFHNGYSRIVYNGREGLLNTKGIVFWSDQIMEGNVVGEVINTDYSEGRSINKIGIGNYWIKPVTDSRNEGTR